MPTTTSGKKLTALAKARVNLAAQHAAQKEREAADESDLEDIFKSRERLGAAGVVRDRAIVAAKERYLSTVESVEVAIGEKLAAMRERGATTASLVTVTELSDAEIRRFTKAFRSSTKDPAAPAEAGGEVAATHDSAVPSESRHGAEDAPTEVGPADEAEAAVGSVSSLAGQE